MNIQQFPGNAALACLVFPLLLTSPLSIAQTLDLQTTSRYSAKEPIAAQRGISAGESMSIRGLLTLDVNASGYAGEELQLLNPQIVSNGNRIQTSTAGRCIDRSTQFFCANHKAVEQVDLKTVLRPDIDALIKSNTPAGQPAVLDGSIFVNTVQQLNNFLITMGRFGRVKGNLTINVPVTLSGVNIGVSGHVRLNKNAQFNNSTLIAGSLEANNIDLQGKNVMLARQNIRLAGKISGGGVISQVTAGGSVDVAGSSAGLLSAVLWAGEEVEIDGNLTLLGGILAGDSVSVNGTVSVSVVSPASRIEAGLGGSANVAAFFESGDSLAVSALLAEYGLKFEPPPASGQPQIYSATDCAESTAQNPRIVSSAGTAVTPGTGLGTYYVDSLGRPYSGVKTVSKPPVATPRTSAVSACATAVGKLGDPTDQGGHLIGLQYGGWGLRLNIAPQYASFNTNTTGSAGNWLQLENGIVKCGNLPSSKSATVTVSLVFPNNTTNRPSTWTASIAVTGIPAISGTFQNADQGGPNGTSTRTSMVGSLVAAGCQ